MTPLRGLHRYAVLTAVATFFLLIAGSLVTSTDSGLAVPDWPLSYGMLFPPMVGGIFYEHGHRMVAGAVGLMILVLAVWIARQESRSWVKRLGFAALAAVFIQALLGGLTVLLLLPPQISIAHACLGQAVFCLTVCLAFATSKQWEDHPAVVSSAAIKRAALILAHLAALQLVLGAVIRHTGEAVVFHVVGGLFLLFFSVYMLILTRQEATQKIIGRFARRLFCLVACQILFGVFVYQYRTAVSLRTLHVGIAALVLAQSVLLAWQAVRCAPLKAEAHITA